MRGLPNTMPPKYSAKHHKSHITRHLIEKWALPKGVKVERLNTYQTHLLCLIDDEKTRMAYQRKELVKKRD